MTGRWCERVESSWYLPRVGEDRERREPVSERRKGEVEALLEPVVMHVHVHVVHNSLAC